MNQATIVFLTLSTFLTPGLRAQAIGWRIDPTHSSAQFSVRHMMISTVHGQFGGVNGTVIYDPKNLRASSVNAT